jgi:exonuclease SbcC
MMIRSIRLLNWRSHADTNLEFRKGTNLIVGIMGAGKSSILEAISFAFFGTFPALERRKLKLEDIIRLNEAQARVILTFGWDGKEYRVERSLERTKRGISSGAELYRDKSMVEHGSVAVTEYLQSLMSLDYDLFTRAIYSEQNNIDHFFNLDPRRRKEEVDALLGLDRFETARTNIVAVINRVRTKREFIDSKFNKGRLFELEAKEKAESVSLAAAESRLADMVLQAQLASKELETRSVSFNRLRLEKESYERLEKDVIRLSAQNDALKKELETQEQADESMHTESKRQLALLSETLAKTITEERACDERMNAVSKEAGTLEARMKAAADSRRRLDSIKSGLAAILAGMDAARLSELQKESEGAVLAAESECKSLEREASEAESLIPRLRPGLSECPLCSSKLSEDGIRHIKSEKAGLIAAKRKRIQEVSALLLSKKKENESLSSRVRKASIAAEQVAVLEAELKAAAQLTQMKSGLDSDLKKLNEERSAIQKRRESISKDTEKLRLRIATMERQLIRRKELLETTSRLSEAMKNLAQIRYDPASYENARAGLESLRIGLERHLAGKKEAEAQLRSSKDVLSLVRSDISQLRSIEKESKDLSQLEEQLSLYKNALLETQTHLRSTLTDAINSAMNEVWPIFYPYKNYPALRLAVSERDYVFEVSDGGAWKALETLASGGERACAALTMRVALAMVLTPKLSWLILDEPTHNLDSAAVGLLSSALETRVPEVVGQTFVITHDEAFMGSEFASSYRLSRDKERNGETRIEAV